MENMMYGSNTVYRWLEHVQSQPVRDALFFGTQL